jgi:hypothetical protein
VIQKTYSIIFVVSSFIVATMISANAGLSATSLRGEQATNSKECGLARIAMADPNNNTWKARLNSWRCFPELIDPD